VRISSRNAELQTIFSLSSKFLSNFGRMQNMSTFDLSTSIKHTTWSFEKSCGECWRSTMLPTAWYWPSCNCIPAQNFVSVSDALNHNPSSWMLDSEKGCAFSNSLHSLYELDRRSQPSWRGCQYWNLQIITHTRSQGGWGPCSPILRPFSHFVLWEAVSQTK